MRWTKLVPALGLGLALTIPGSARATDGHFLHGVGAVNSSMGGAGIAAPVSLLGTFYLNPAGLMAFDGMRVEFGAEMFEPERTVASDFGPGGAGSTTSTSSFVPIPAMGWSYKFNERAVVGIGMIGIGGFGTDYSADPTNPILGPRPFGGFGQVFSNYQLMQISPSVAFAPTDQLWIGVSANIDWSSLAVDPMPIGAPAFDPGTGSAFFSSAAAASTAFGFGAHVGVLYNVNDMIAIGATYQTETYFEDFNFKTTWANPNITNPTNPMAFGFPRTIQFTLNLPAVVGGGIAVQALPELLLAGDFRYILYSETDGFALADPTQPFNADGSVSGFGWEDISSIHLGADFRASDKVSLRAGYNVTENPVPDGLSMINIPAPAIVKNHVTFGVGVRPTRQFEISAGYMHAFENSGTGPILNPAAPAGATVTNTLSENSVSIQFSWTTRGSL